MNDAHDFLYVKLSITYFLVLTCLAGDRTVESSQHVFFKVLADNLTHAIVGTFTGMAYALLHHKRISRLFGLTLIMICCIVSSLMDLDHFVAARSFYLEDARSLTERPILHCSTFVLVLLVAFCLTSRCSESLKVSLVLGSVIAALFTHHTRDALRRGYWLCPYGSTRRLPYSLYICLTVVTPYFLYLLQGLMQSSSAGGRARRQRSACSWLRSWAKRDPGLVENYQLLDVEVS